MEGQFFEKQTKAYKLKL